MKSRKEPRGKRRTGLGPTIALLLSVGLVLDANAAPTDTGGAVRVARATVLRVGDAVTGALPMSAPIHVEVALKLRNRDALDAFVANNAIDQAKGKPAQLMTPAQVLANHAPTQQQAQSVADWLTSQGFRNVTIAPNRLLVSADGTAARARNAFMTSFVQVRTQDGRMAYANSDDARIPMAMGDKVLAVAGLQDVHRAVSAIEAGAPAAVRNPIVTAHEPTEFAAVYGGAGMAPAANVVVGLVAQGDLSSTLRDLDDFARRHGLPVTDVRVVPVRAVAASVATGTSQLESQSLLGMAGRVRKLVLYDVPELSDASLLAAFGAIVADDTVRVIAFNAVACTSDAQASGQAAAVDQLLELAVGQGKTVAAPSVRAAGLDCPGTNGALAAWPAASTHVIAVAGSRLEATGTLWLRESVYSDEGIPPAPAFAGDDTVSRWRSRPDVAFPADPESGAVVVVNGRTERSGGGALSVALFAGAWARALQQRPSLGFAGPVLQALPDTAFHRVVADGVENASARSAGRGSLILDNGFGDASARANQPPVADFIATGDAMATFTDDSTDPDGRIVKHAWHLANGQTSSGPIARETFLQVGFYKIAETVWDDDGASATKGLWYYTQGDEVHNGGFENGLVPWHNHGGNRVCSDPTHVHSGNCAFVMTTGGTSLHLPFGPPTVGVAGATLSLYVQVLGPDAPVGDKLRLELEDRNGKLLTVLDTFTNRDPHRWVHRTYNVLPWAGKSALLRFNGNGAKRVGAQFCIDDVSLELTHP